MAEVQMTALHPPSSGTRWMLRMSDGYAAVLNHLGEEVDYIPSGEVPARLSFPTPLLSHASLTVAMPHGAVKSMQFKITASELQTVRAYVDQCLIRSPDKAKEMEVVARRGAVRSFCWAGVGFLAGVGGAVFAFTTLPFEKWAHYSAWIFFLLGGVVCLIQGVQGLSEAGRIRQLLAQGDQQPRLPPR